MTLEKSNAADSDKKGIIFPQTNTMPEKKEDSNVNILFSKQFTPSNNLFG